ncbi:hypothetical protein [Mycolicibacterium thermoresistibile]
MTTADEPTDSLLAALSKTRIPVGNHEFIRQFTTAIGIANYRAEADVEQPYVVATRRNGVPDLHICYGYTTGFISRDEIVQVAGPGAVGRPSSRKGTWYVEHPINRVRPAGERARSVRRQGGFCGCGMELSVTGACASRD